MTGRALEWIDRVTGRTIAFARWLVLPVSSLLFLQWPLRDLVHTYSREANDLAQWLFALYVSVALTCATRERAHLAASVMTQRYSPASRARIGNVATLLGVVPWSLFVLIAGAPSIWRSIMELERFPETYNPGYFIVKASVWLLAFLMLVQALRDIRRPSGSS